MFNRDKKYAENFLKDALMFPTDKFSNMPRTRYHSPTGLPWIPSGRYFEDYISSGKFMTDLDIVGYSVNPGHLEDLNVDWLNILSYGTRSEGRYWNRKIKFIVFGKLIKVGITEKIDIVGVLMIP